jgi:hypothetical protein
MPAGVDFGALRDPPWLRGAKTTALAAGVVVGAAAVAAYFAAGALLDAQKHRAYASAWTIDGPPCPRISQAAYRTLAIRQPQPFAFEGIRGVRAHGDVSCSVIDEYQGRAVAEFPVCELTSPFVVAVKAADGGVAYFEPGVGQPATLSLPNGRLGCVLGANEANF